MKTCSRQVQRGRVEGDRRPLSFVEACSRILEHSRHSSSATSASSARTDGSEGFTDTAAFSVAASGKVAVVELLGSSERPAQQLIWLPVSDPKGKMLGPTSTSSRRTGEAAGRPLLADALAGVGAGQ